MVAIKSLTTILTYVVSLCGIIPLFPWLTLTPRLILVAGILSGIWQCRTGRWQLKPWLQNCTIVPVFFYYALQFSHTNPVQPVISVLAIMLAVRLIGEKTVRHSLQIYALSMFCLASSSLFDLSPVFLVYLTVLLFTVSLATILLTFQDQDDSMIVSLPDLKRILLIGLIMPILAIPLLLFFFPIMPRTPLPLWNFLSPPVTRTSGYSDSVSPGSQSSIATAQTLAFRAEMPRQEQSKLYWRGTVFNRTDGIRWTRISQIPAEQTEINGQTVKQAIYPEPSATHTLIALDRPTSLTLQRVKRSPDGVFERIGGSGARINYVADSLTTGVASQKKSFNRFFYLQLPNQLPLRIKSLAAEAIRNSTNDRSRVAFLENYFRRGNYQYSTRDLATGTGAIEQFLFEKKRGHCEFFASSFALILRAAGVPCRIVGGYLGGEYNQLGGYYIVTDARAHVWVEAYMEGSGWVRIDPSSFATNAGEVWKSQNSLSLKLRLSLALDSINHSWNRMVIPYDFAQQMNVVNTIGSRIQGIWPLQIIRSMLPFGAGVILLALLFYVNKHTSYFRLREERILYRFLRVVEKKFGISAVEGRTGLFEIAAIADNHYVTDFVTIYAGAIYHDQRLTDNECERLRDVLKKINDMESKKS